MDEQSSYYKVYAAHSFFCIEFSAEQCLFEPFPHIVW